MVARMWLVCGLLLCAAPALAFDGARTGFILGFGVGGAVVFDNEDWTGPTQVRADTVIVPPDTIITNYTLLYGSASLNDTRAALVTDFQIGVGITEHWAIYYSNYVAWFA